MKYIALIYSAPQSRPAPGSAAFEDQIARYREIAAAWQEAGVLLAGEALQPVETATSIRVRNGKVELTDGPFAETRETLGGFYLFECESLDEAIRHASMIPTAEHGTVELRPVLSFG